LYSPVLYFDATSSVIDCIPKQKRPFLYSLVCHDSLNKTIIPICEFLTTQHTSKKVSQYLSAIKSNLDDEMQSAISIIVTDFSWTLMHAIITTFNHCSVMTYLNWCFDHLYGKGIHSLSI
jgi:hypothetical protein